MNGKPSRNILSVLCLFLGAALGVSACHPDSVELKMPDFAADATLKTEMAKLAGYRIWFGHQSVGGNIVEGLQELQRLSGAPGPQVVHYRGGDSLPPAFFAETPVGENLHPQSKFDAACRLLDGDLAGKIDIALVKICFVDLSAESGLDPDAVFSGYLKAVRGLEAAHPGLRIIPVTSPLTTRGYGARGRLEALEISLKEFLGRPDDNLKRGAFNARIRDTFRDRVIFDLAAVESTYPDGTRELYGKGGRTEALIRAYSTDGGHLNPLGRKLAARELVRALAKVDIRKP